MARILEPELAEINFMNQGVRLNSWNGLETLKPKHNQISSFFCTGKSVYELMNISKHVANWLKNGSWKILQIDNSSYFYPDQESILSTLLLGPTQQLNLSENRTFLFDFGIGEKEDFQTEAVFSHLIYLMLVYEAHCYFLSSGGDVGEMISVQDGTIYFYGDYGRICLARKLLDDLTADPMRPVR